MTVFRRFGARACGLCLAQDRSSYPISLHAFTSNSTIQSWGRQMHISICTAVAI